MDIKNGMRPVHPGEILREEIEAAGVSTGAWSKALDVSLSRVTPTLEGHQGITTDSRRGNCGRPRSRWDGRP